MQDEEKLKAEAAWNLPDVLAAEMGVRRDIVVRLMNMVEKEECTIPFIARYRKEHTNGMDPDSLRNFVQALDELRAVQKKSSAMIKSVQKQGMLDLKTEISLISARNVEELNLAYAPFKGEKKSSLANRARALGLDDAANSVLNTPSKTNLRKWVVKGMEGRATLSEVETGVKHVIADMLSKERPTMEKVREIFQPRGMTLESKLSTTKKKEADSTFTRKQETGMSKSSTNLHTQDLKKYQLYHDFSCSVVRIKSYQVLAINRGEVQKHLTVKVTISKDMENLFLTWSRKHWTTKCTDPEILNLMKQCIEDSYNRLVKPFILRKARSDLTTKAQQEAVEVFSRNLQKLLLTPPLCGKVVLGVDPGFRNGCKCAVISGNGGKVLATDVFYLNSLIDANRKVKQLYNKHEFDVIAIGNGTACRETESFFSDFIAKNKSLNLAYCIVNENGASIYSVTSEAKNELPDLDPNLRSAVSIARRLQDPLMEMVKIEPKHIGVGMYQHDIPDKELKSALDDVIEDCVTFIGVDLNVANESMLNRIAGLKKSQVKNIIKRRSELGAFVNRYQLLEVKGIGEKTFQQCAGFIRISRIHLKSAESVKTPEEPTTELADTSSRKRKAKTVPAKSKKKKVEWEPNPLDQTWIHPESYLIAERFIEGLGLRVQDLGKKCFVDRVKAAMYDTGMTNLAQSVEADVSSVQLIADGLSQEAGYRDIRNEMRRPLFRRGITSLEDLQRKNSGRKVSGRVTNVTDFGAFVDIGVGHDGLIHCSELGGRWEELKRCIGPNDTVEVLVRSVDLLRKRISLGLIQADMFKTTFR